jgi:hypothetical protein
MMQPSRPKGRRSIEVEPDRLLRLFLCGDVMTGRGIDQILPRPGNQPCLKCTYATRASTSNWPRSPTAQSRGQWTSRTRGEMRVENYSGRNRMCGSSI